MKRIFTACLSLALFTISAYAQPGCPAIDAGNDVSILCGQNNCVTLNATPFLAGVTTDYTVGSIPYTPFQYNAGTAILVNIDDIWSSALPLPFDFCFYGNSYNQVVVGSNGIITFDVNQAGNGCQWPIADPIPSVNNPTNSIMGPWHDIDPSITGQIFYQVTGTYPCRTFIVSYYEVAMFETSCNNLLATHQIVLYETTNAIEVYIQDKPLCASWNDGAAIVGIQDPNGTQAVVAPGRNFPTQWTATNEAWRFTPNGPPAYSLAWYDMANNVIGSSDTLQICPTDTTDFAAEITYFACDGSTVVVRDTVRVNSQQTFVATINNVTDVSCFGLSNGSVSASVSGGTGPVTYGWSPGGANQLTLSNLSGGNYVFTVADAVCSFSDTVTVIEPAVLNVTVPDSTLLTCNTSGNIAGLISQVSGGTASYTYLWSNGSTTSSLGSIAPGNYSLTVTDANGCTDNDNGTSAVTLAQVTFVNPVIVNVGCLNNGSITATAINVVPPVTYTWSNGGTGATISNLQAGNYTVSATDASGCSASTSYAVTAPSNVVTATISTIDVACFGGANGSATANAAGGGGGYTYNWSTGGTSATISNLQAGSVTVTVTDAGSCTTLATATINQPATAVSGNHALDLHLCANPPYGNVTITGAGGTGAYSYTLTGVGTTTSGVFGNVSPGTYGYTVVDSNNCTFTGNLIIPAGNPDGFTQNVVPTSCFGPQFTDGSIELIPTVPANGPFQYSLNGGAFQSTNIFTGLAQGTYTVAVNNGNNCSDTLSIVVNQPAQALVNTVPDTVLVQPNAPTQLGTTVQNFNSPLYSWSPAAGLSCTDCFNPMVTANQTTVYTVTASEENNSQCAAVDSVVVIVLGGVVMPDAFTPNGDGKNDMFGPVSYGNITIKSFRVYNRWGEVVHNSIDAWDGKFDEKEQAAGTYEYFITMETPDPDKPGQIKSIAKQGSVSLLR
jgi:gliding motility-associated-like protein